jgi:hypothetical protein
MSDPAFVLLIQTTDGIYEWDGVHPPCKLSEDMKKKKKKAAKKIAKKERKQAKKAAKGVKEGE